MKSVISAIVLLLCPISFASANPYDDLVVSMGAANYYPFASNFNDVVSANNGLCTGGTCTFGNVLAPNVTGATANDAYWDGSGVWHNTVSANVNTVILPGTEGGTAFVFWMKTSSVRPEGYVSNFSGGFSQWIAWGFNSRAGCDHSLVFHMNYGSLNEYYCTTTIADDGLPHMYAQSCGNPSSPGPSPCQISVDGVLQYGGNLVIAGGGGNFPPTNIVASSSLTGGLAIFNRYITLDEARALYCAGIGFSCGGPPPTVRIIE